MSSDHDRSVLDTIFNPYLPFGENMKVRPTLEDEETDNDKTTSTLEAKNLELKGVVKAEDGELNVAIELLTKAIELAPHRASTFNNRAQAYRLAGNDTDALADLSQAVLLSGGKSRVRMQALCQRALIHRRQGDDLSAHKDFQAAADLGSDFARQQLVQMNPYAAMCNQMLGQVFRKLQNPTDPV